VQLIFDRIPVLYQQAANAQQSMFSLSVFKEDSCIDTNMHKVVLTCATCRIFHICVAKGARSHL